MREVLEVRAARWAAQRREPSDIDELQLLDAAFHQSIVQAAGNQFLEQTQGVLAEILVQRMTTTLTVEGRLESSRIEHRAILDAIVEGDGRRAGTAARASALRDAPHGRWSETRRL